MPVLLAIVGAGYYLAGIVLRGTIIG